MPGAVWIGLVLLCGALLLELVVPQKITEGFQQLVPVLSKRPSFFSQYVPKRGDVGPAKEQAGYIMDPRYFHDYVDVQRYGVDQDYCRLVVPKGGKTKDSFFACALAGTGETSTVVFATNTVNEGLKLSRDDYMRDIMKDGRAAYCRILKGKDGTYQPLCRRALDTHFSERDEVDPDPPEEMVKMLSFYDGCKAWLRLRDDMIDYVGNLRVMRAGSIAINEKPLDKSEPTEGLRFDGAAQYLRIADSADLTFGSIINLRTIRAFSVWVYFDKFTNNAHFFDFGDGPGKNNVFLGILGKGDPQIGGGGEIRPLICGAESTVPEGPSGAQTVEEVSPKELMKTTRANVDEYVDIDQEVQARVLPPSTVRMPRARGPSNKATLHYEVWDQRQRKMSVKINGAIEEKKWTHIVITAITGDATRPDIAIFVNGEQIFVQPSGFLPQPTMTTNNYLGKSNWANDSSTYELRDELFCGKMFDFRMYTSQMSQGKIKDTYKWGQKQLGLST